MNEFICLKCAKFRKCLLETTIKGTESECEFIDKARRLEDDGTLCEEAEEEIGIRPLNLLEHRHYPEVDDLDDSGAPMVDYKKQLNEVCEVKDIAKIRTFNEINSMKSKSFDDARKKAIYASLYFGIKKRDVAKVMRMSKDWLDKILAKK